MKDLKSPQRFFLKLRKIETLADPLGERSVLVIFTTFLLPLLILLGCQISTNAWGTTLAARLFKIEGEIDYRKRGAINWMPLGDIRELQPGDLLFLKKSARADLEYLGNGTIVHLSDQTLFRVTQKAPIHSKRVHVFGIEKNNVGSDLLEKRNPFERGMVRNAKEASDGDIPKSESRLQVYRNVSEIALDKPAAGSLFVVRQFPAKLLVKVDKAKAESKYWVFVWGEDNNVTPIWSSYSNGEFSDISIEQPGTYELQVFNDNETEISDPIKVEYQKSDENFRDLGSKLGNLKGDQTVILE